MTRVLLINWAGVNSGDDFLCEVIVSKLRHLFPDWKLHLLSEAYVEAVADQIDIARWRPFFNAMRSFKEFRGMCSEIYKADRILIGGGDVIRPEFLSMLPLLTAVILQKPVVLIGVGVIVEKSTLWRKIYRIAMTAVDSALVRDIHSQRALQSILSSRIEIAPDLVFGASYRGIDESRSDDDRKNIVVNLRSVSDPVYSRRLPTGDVNDENICNSLAKALDLIAVSGRYDVVLLPMVDDRALLRGYAANTSDLTILRRLRDALPPHVRVTLLEHRPRRLSELHEIYSNAAIVIAMRLHAIVPALAWGTPVVAVPYASKIEVLRTMFGDLKTISLSDLACGNVEAAISALQETLAAPPDRELSGHIEEQASNGLETILRELARDRRAKPRFTSVLPTVASIAALIAFFIKNLCSGKRTARKIFGKANSS
jgi:polysaccharide pyruvyl transferase WcaK-like protein